MSDPQDRDYYARRAAAARRQAENAADAQIAGIHREMATRYEALSRPVPAPPDLTAA